LADRGASKKSKSRGLTLNIRTPLSLRNSVPLNLKSGLVYKGSTLGTPTFSNPAVSHPLSTVTYQKGSNVYIMPYKTKIAVPELRQGYAGIKLIIRTQ
jgi:hypothetical protein